MTEARVERLRIVLVETTHPGNIGAVARAMKSMGLARLALVRPRRFPCAEATARAAGADDVLDAATLHETLADAVADCAWVAGTSARRARHVAWPELDPTGCARDALVHAASGEVAVVFGREQRGLSNAELEHCHALVHVPTDPAFSSLNLAAAVQILAWELRKLVLDEAGDGPAVAAAGSGHAPATVADLEGFYDHLERALAAIGYFERRSPRLLMRRLRRLFNRAGMERVEIDMLRGVLSATERAGSTGAGDAGGGSERAAPEAPAGSTSFRGA